VLLGDEVDIADKKLCLKKCVDLFSSVNEGSVIGVRQVPSEEVSKYGVAEFDATSRIQRLVEKPRPQESQSNWIIPGRYVFENAILDELSRTAPSRNGEIQLTDAMASLLRKRALWAQPLFGECFDTGSKSGFLLANLAQGLKDPELSNAIKSFLKEKNLF
jgi:UTP--glucose-1-phosphate uridylyltransferase